MRIAALALGVVAACPGAATAEPGSGPHGTIENRLTTTEPGAPTGSHFEGRYHAAGDPEGDPPYLRRMTFYPPAGMRYDRSVPDRCSASDLQLQLEGSGACPPGSRLGGGKAYGKFMGNETELNVETFNNTDEIVMVIRTPIVTTVSRGEFGPDGSITFESPTCYPALPPGCPVDTALQLGSSVAQEPYTRTVDGEVRAYVTTPPTCPESGYWEQPVRFWWADGSEETMVPRAPCAAPPAG
jgi:hypothetical protein